MESTKPRIAARDERFQDESGKTGVSSGDVLTQLLRRRVAEFGVRRAIGARDAHILNMVLRQSGLPVLGGLLLGFALTFGLSRLIASLLYGSAAIHPTILATVALALVVSSALAILRPTLAALRVDPMEALRAD